MATWPSMTMIYALSEVLCLPLLHWSSSVVLQLSHVPPHVRGRWAQELKDRRSEIRRYGAATVPSVSLLLSQRCDLRQAPFSRCYVKWLIIYMILLIHAWLYCECFAYLLFILITSVQFHIKCRVSDRGNLAWRMSCCAFRSRPCMVKVILAAEE